MRVGRLLFQACPAQPRPAQQQLLGFVQGRAHLLGHHARGLAGDAGEGDEDQDTLEGGHQAPPVGRVYLDVDELLLLQHVEAMVSQAG